MLTAANFPSVATLFAPDAEVRVEGLRVAEGGVIHVALLCPRRTAACPLCGQQASSIQSAYSRSLADLAWRGFLVHLAVLVRRFRCLCTTCSRPVCRASGRSRGTVRVAHDATLDHPDPCRHGSRR